MLQVLQAPCMDFDHLHGPLLLGLLTGSVIYPLPYSLPPPQSLPPPPLLLFVPHTVMMIYTLHLQDVNDFSTLSTV